jgi:Tfp pilus assembly protein PilV
MARCMPDTRSDKARSDEQGMMLLEALVAMVIVATVTISFIGIRTDAMIDATSARNWRLAREIAEEKLSELMAGAHELPPESGIIIPIEKYEGFSYKIELGETAVSEAESQVASEAAGDNAEAKDRVEWERNRQNYRRAQDLGLSSSEFEDQQYDDINERLAETPPSGDDFEEVAVVVFFKKLAPDYPNQDEALLIKARVSTLAISGLTPEQAEGMADSSSSGDPSSTAGGAPGLPTGEGR